MHSFVEVFDKTNSHFVYNMSVFIDIVLVYFMSYCLCSFLFTAADAKLVSGSTDKTVCLWKEFNGKVCSPIFSENILNVAETTVLL